MESSVDREQLSLQHRCLRVDTAALCDDVENAVGDVLCDGLDELEDFLAGEDTITEDPEQIRESVDRLTHKYTKHAEDNCKVFKSYSLQHMFMISPEMAERVRQPEARLPTARHGVHTADEEAAMDVELAQLQERVHAANGTLGVLQQEESALSQQLDQSAKRLEWLSSLSSAASPMEEDMKVVAKQVDEVQATATSIRDGLSQMDREPPVAGAEGLAAVTKQFTADRATTTTASRDDALQLGARVAGD